MNESIGFVIPTYNPDLETLLSYIEDVRAEIAPTTIRVEIDAPDAATRRRLESAADEVHAADQRRGKGQAIIDGFDALSTNILAFADADGSVPATSMVSVIRGVREVAPVSIGSRRHPESEIVQHQTVGRRILGDAFAFVSRRLLTTSCYDYQCGAKAVRAEAWERIRPHCREEGFAWDLEFVSIAGSLGYEITEVPVKWDDHPDSTVNPFWTTVELATAVASLWYRTNVTERNSSPWGGQTTSSSTRYDPEE